MTVRIPKYYAADNLPVFVAFIPVDVPLVDCGDVADNRVVVLLLI